MQIAILRRAWHGWLAGFIALSAAGWWWHGHNSATQQVAAAPFGNKAVSVTQSFAKLPLAFEPNQGQGDGRVLFLSRNPGYSLFLTAQEAVVSLRGAAQPVHIAWQGANPNPEVAGLETLPGKHNYLRGSDPAKWHRDIPTYGKVRYRDLYPGIDLVYYGRQQHLEYDLVVAPGADPSQIRLQLAGMDAMNLDKEGALHLQVAEQSLTLGKPIVYQETAGEKKTVDGEYVLSADKQVSLKLAAYDVTKPLVIDPVLTYSTYLGGSGAEQGMGIAVDGNGNIYMVGQTASVNFPFTTETKSATDSDVFVAMFDSGGTLQAATYLGGAGTDRGFAIAADNSAVYIVGDTDSTNLPVLLADQPNKGGSSTDIDAFVAKFDSTDLNLLFSTYLGGSDGEEGLGIALDNSSNNGNIYVVGATLSSNFPITIGGAFNASTTDNNCDNPSPPGNPIPCSDAFVAKYNNSGVKQYALYLGGAREDVATAIAVNNAGEAYVTGVTYSTVSFPGITTASFQKIFNGGVGDAFIITLDNAGAVSYGTYLGGDGWDQGQAIALDNSGNVYIAGTTNSSNLPVTNPLQASYAGGGYDGFVAKIKPSNAVNSQIQYLTYLGGSKQDQAFGIAVNSTSGVAIVVGETMSADFPENSPLQSIWFGGGKNNWGDAFVTQIGASGALGWSTYLGGSDDDWANSVAMDGTNGIYLAGSSFSSDFPTTANPYQASVAGNSDAILLKLTDSSAVSADLQASVSGSPDLVGTGETLTYSVIVSNNSTIYDAGGVVVLVTLPSGITLNSATVPGGSCTSSGAQVTCNVGTITTSSSATITLATVNNTAGDITFIAKVVRANQPDADLSNNSASITTKAALGSSSGGGAWSLLEWIVGMMAYFVMRRRGVQLR